MLLSEPDRVGRPGVRLPISAFWEALNPSAENLRTRFACFRPHPNLVPEQFFERKSSTGRLLRQKNG
jgi:hypothetical protein